jgi:hypothetical protein
MRYSEDHIYEIRSYCKKIGLDWELVDYPRSEEQANMLLEVQNNIPIYREEYALLEKKMNHDPQRLRNKAVKGIEAIMEYLPLYTKDKDAIMDELSKLNHFLTNTDERRAISYTAESSIREIKKNIMILLLSVGFSETNIEEEISPIIIKRIKYPAE